MGRQARPLNIRFLHGKYIATAAKTWYNNVLNKWDFFSYNNLSINITSLWFYGVKRHRLLLSFSSAIINTELSDLVPKWLLQLQQSCSHSSHIKDKKKRVGDFPFKATVQSLHTILFHTPVSKYIFILQLAARETKKCIFYEKKKKKN